MNLVQTLPELKAARLNGLDGVGYAEVISGPGNTEECRGVIVFNDPEEAAVLEAGQTEFEGVVYREGEAYRERMPVEIVFLNNDQHHEPGATFVALRVSREFMPC